MYERRVFFPATSSVSAARHWAAAVLADRFPEDVTDDALLCVSELAANAVQHAGTAYEVRLNDAAGPLCISVVDDDVSFTPHATPSALPGPMAEAGRGLAIVAAVSTRYGTSLEGGRKVVWCELPAG